MERPIINNDHKFGTVQEDGKYEDGDPEILNPPEDDNTEPY